MAFGGISPSARMPARRRCWRRPTSRACARSRTSGVRRSVKRLTRGRTQRPGRSSTCCPRIPCSRDRERLRRREERERRCTTASGSWRRLGCWCRSRPRRGIGCGKRGGCWSCWSCWRGWREGWRLGANVGPAVRSRRSAKLESRIASRTAYSCPADLPSRVAPRGRPPRRRTIRLLGTAVRRPEALQSLQDLVRFCERSFSRSLVEPKCRRLTSATPPASPATRRSPPPRPAPRGSPTRSATPPAAHPPPRTPRPPR